MANSVVITENTDAKLKQNKWATPNTSIFLSRFLRLLKTYYGKQMRAGTPRTHARTHAHIPYYSGRPIANVCL